MKNLEIKGENGVFNIPTVSLNASMGYCEISGKSSLEDADEFYNVIIKWIEQYVKEVKGAINFNFKLTSYGMGSSAGIFNILKELKKYKDDGGSVTINWYYPNSDDSIAEKGESYVKSTGLHLNMYSYFLGD